MEVKRLAAIDIGSNAMRLLIMNIFETNHQPVFKKASLVRVPVRLGQEVFTKGLIPEEKVQTLITAIKSYQYLMMAFNVIQVKACATSAMREAENGREIVRRIKEETGIEVEIISGRKEADVIYSNHIENLLDQQNSYLYVDVGGGSTEMTLYTKGEPMISRSFKIGTVRVLEGMVTEKMWKSLKKWIKKITADHKPVYLIGSGGNINRLMKMSPVNRKKSATPSMSREQVQTIYKNILAVPFEQRISKFDMNPDRADVIIPASEMLISIMKWSGAKRVYVPQFGLADGLVRELYEEHKAEELVGQD